MYQVKEVFYTVQGEGRHVGRPAVFLRFAGCNLWSGREHSRSRAVCRFCDTDFVGIGPDGGQFRDAGELAAAVRAVWPSTTHRRVKPYVVCTGGEPTLQLDSQAVAALHDVGFEVGIETNGTRPVPAGVDWVCVSPKAGADLVTVCGDELKLVYPQTGAEPWRYEDLPFGRLLLQPMDGPDLSANTIAALKYCLANPQWTLSIQTHKLIGVR